MIEFGGVNFGLCQFNKAGGGKGAVKTAPATGVAGNANLLDQQQNGIGIAIQPGFLQVLDLAGCFALAPEFLRLRE